jgi:hypothetical protein
MCNKGQEAISLSVIHRGQAHILPTPNSPSFMGQASTVSCIGGSCLHPASIFQVSTALFAQQADTRCKLPRTADVIDIYTSYKILSALQLIDRQFV